MIGSLLSMAPLSSAGESPRVFSSGPQRVSLVELYSSEGCSSTPPADQYFSKLKSHPDLWKKFVPVKLQVDYWNYLGWADSLSSSDYSHRQRELARSSGASGVYTPEFFVNGREWRTSRLGSSLETQLADHSNPGILQATLELKNNVTLQFTPNQSTRGNSYVFFLALLENRLSRKIGAGENNGRTLTHDFILIKLVKISGVKQGNAFVATLPFSVPQKGKTRQYSFAAWVQETKTPQPIQAVGGDF